MPNYYVINYKHQTHGGICEVLVIAEDRRDAMRQVIDSPHTNELEGDMASISAYRIELLSALEEELADIKARDSEGEDDAEAGK